MQTGAGAVINSLKLQPGQTIAVFGTGGVGLSAVMAARIAGATRIVAIDPVRARLDLAAELGATDVIDAGAGDAAGAVRRLLPHGVDFTLNTTIVPSVFTQAVGCLANRGVAGFVTAPRGDWVPDMFGLLAGGKSLRGILGGDSVARLLIPTLIEFYRQGRFPFDRLIRYYPLADIAQAFRDSEEGRTIKPVLRMLH